ncbi:MAG: hydrogenase maturation protease [Gottschalkiaceae bacterium]|nr:MAG: hydrogenase maturation protease [Gottschalkiaceae bacterium]
MGRKLIAIGNRLMGDDGIAIYLAESMKAYLEKIGFDVIIGETDISYCLSKIETNDFIIILDAFYHGLKPGSVSMITLKEAASKIRQYYSQHEPNIIKCLDIYNIDVTGLVIGIEVNEIEFKWELSDVMKDLFPQICEQVKDTIIKIL